MQSSQIEQETGVPSWIDDAEMAEYVRVVQKEIKKGLDTRGNQAITTIQCNSVTVLLSEL